MSTISTKPIQWAVGGSQTSLPIEAALSGFRPAVCCDGGHQIGLPRVARDLIADMRQKIGKWHKNHVDGAIVAKQIALTIGDATEEFSKDLEELLSNLDDVYKKLEIDAKSLDFLAGQMTAMVKFYSNDQPLLYSMSPDDVRSLMCDIAKAYNQELVTKEYVLSNIGVSKTKREAMFHAICWLQQQYVTQSIRGKLELLLAETGLTEYS